MAQTQDRLLELVAEALANHLKEGIPESGSFRPIRYYFDIYGTSNEGFMQIERRYDGTSGLTIGVLRQGTDRLYNNFLPGGTNQELLRQLEDPANIKVWLGYLMELSSRVDEYWD